jgi:DNA-binding XRE family transcriptional regulator
MNIQVINQNGKPEYAVLPYPEYLLLLEKAEMLEDIHSYDEAKKAISSGDEELIPASVVNVLTDGENPIKVWREYRGFTQQEFAEQIGISVPYVSQLETNKRTPSIDVIKRMAAILKVDIDDLT